MKSFGLECCSLYFDFGLSVVVEDKMNDPGVYVVEASDSAAANRMIPYLCGIHRNVHADIAGKAGHKFVNWAGSMVDNMVDYQTNFHGTVNFRWENHLETNEKTIIQ